MEYMRMPKSFGCNSHKNLSVILPRPKSKSSSSSQSSPRSKPQRSPSLAREEELFIVSRSKSSISSQDSPRGGPQRSPSLSREDEFRQVFCHFDGDKDGKISAFELRAYFGSIGEHISHEDAQDMVDQLDTDGDGFIDFEDFKKMLVQKGGADNDDEHLKAAFEMYEIERGSGRITPKSLQRALSRLGDPKSYDECVTMIQFYDIDGNGELDYHEFRQMMV